MKFIQYLNGLDILKVKLFGVHGGSSSYLSISLDAESCAPFNLAPRCRCEENTTQKGQKV